MNGPNDPPDQPAPELELARPARGPVPSAQPQPRPSVSNPAMQQVRSAARAQPLEPEAKKATAERLKEGAVDTVLNSFSILSEVVDDFKSSDRFFKYKALVLTTWLLLSVGAFGVACPSTGPANEINAVLVQAGDAAAPVYMVKNESGDTWQDVEIIVNERYRSTMSQLEAGGGNATLSPAVLFDDSGHRAPNTLQITDIVVKVRDPEAEVTLLHGGAPVN